MEFAVFGKPRGLSASSSPSISVLRVRANWRTPQMILIQTMTQLRKWFSSRPWPLHLNTAIIIEDILVDALDLTFHLKTATSYIFTFHYKIIYLNFIGEHTKFFCMTPLTFLHKFFPKPLRLFSFGLFGTKIYLSHPIYYLYASYQTLIFIYWHFSAYVCNQKDF